MKKLHVDSITKSYDNKVLLSDIFISCEIGEIKGLLGRNGCGKSTLLKIIFGIENSDSKFVRIGDKVIQNVSHGRGLLNYLPQENFLPNDVRVKSLITLFLSKENRNIVLENFYVKPLWNKKVKHLSGGEKRIIEILLVIHSQAKYLLLDEPFNGVSPLMVDYIIAYIKKMKIDKGIIITDHDYENVIKVSDTVSFLKDGYLKELKDNKQLVELGYLTTATYNAVFT
ncbi:ATP-binding cassette domain-containing protein [uncultured Maribacter sp.]|uniref:ATP-binding cassette domain-containing protein n=1 Tax=uncultured Maribacter sp. TaxID=431308 RepID=UPI0026161720|nr:ATP-binding cassette domain-containing protein [uncultured Maribacter sp.]